MTEPMTDREYEEQRAQEIFDENVSLHNINAKLRKIIDKQDLLIKELYMIADTSGSDAETLARAITETIETTNRQLGERP